MSWPWPGDTALDAARRVAQSYRTALLEHAPAAAATLDAKIIDWGQDWIAPQLATVDPEAWVTVDVAAAHTGKTVKTIYAWASRDARITPRHCADGRLRVRLGEVLAANAELRRQRADRAR